MATVHERRLPARETPRSLRGVPTAAIRAAVLVLALLACGATARPAGAVIRRTTRGAGLFRVCDVRRGAGRQRDGADCTGALVAPSVVLTVAHCALPVSSYVIATGLTDLGDTSGARCSGSAAWSSRPTGIRIRIAATWRCCNSRSRRRRPRCPSSRRATRAGPTRTEHVLVARLGPHGPDLHRHVAPELARPRHPERQLLLPAIHRHLEVRPGIDVLCVRPGDDRLGLQRGQRRAGRLDIAIRHLRDRRRRVGDGRREL